MVTVDEAFPAPRWCLVLVPAISFSASLSTPCCPGAPSLGGDFGDCVGHLEVSSALPPPSPWHWGSLDLAQLLVSQPRLRCSWPKPIRGCMSGWSGPSRGCPLQRTLEGVQGADSIPQSFIFPPKVPAIPNSQCSLVLS